MGAGSGAGLGQCQGRATDHAAPAKALGVSGAGGDVTPEQVSPVLLEIAQLDLSLAERVRADITQDAVEDYAAWLDALPPVRVAVLQGKRVVIGGRHRIEAYRQAGRAEIPCIVEPMTWAAAVLAAAADNRLHRVRMTRADKRAAIRLLLTEPVRRPTAPLPSSSVALLRSSGRSGPACLASAPSRGQSLRRLEQRACRTSRRRCPDRTPRWCPRWRCPIRVPARRPHAGGATARPTGSRRGHAPRCR